MSDSAHTAKISRLYDLFQTSFESSGKEQKFLNYGYTITGRESYELRQAQLCLEVFRAAELAKDHVVVDVGFGSGEQDFLLAETHEFARIIGYNIALQQVRYASARAAQTGMNEKLEFRHGPAEELPGLASNSVDRVLAIECAFYFDRPRFYRRAAEVLKPGGRLVLADISFADALRSIARKRVGTASGNRAEWEKHFRTRSIVPIHKHTRPGAQMTVSQILKAVVRTPLGWAQRGAWLKMAAASQIVVLGLWSRAFHYDLIVLEKP
ncbi:MAG TPA: class I SAM-dependent methyltransferase [Thermoanaerobaculia bacterium]|nr:class I SAM-dependent methyltransferase [Thermoanaerobaculia bacterium]